MADTFQDLISFGLNDEIRGLWGLDNCEECGGRLYAIHENVPSPMMGCEGCGGMFDIGQTE